MMSLFAYPLALLGLLSIPALVWIYRLRRRVQRRRVVSSLMLWSFQQEPQEGGRQVQRFRAPLFFFLELLILLLLCAAAVGPQIASSRFRPTLFVVLDDSLSMQANASNSPRARAEKALLDEVAGGNYRFVRLVLGRETPQLVGGFLRTSSQVKDALRGWTCRASAAHLSRAVALALSLGQASSRVLVLTDHAPSSTLTQGRVTWRAVGEPLDNVAFVAASRSRVKGKSWCMLTLANFSKEPQTVALRLHTGTSLLRKQTLTLSAKETRRLTFALPLSTRHLRATLSSDALALDNEVHLLSPSQRPVRVQFKWRDASWKSAVEPALQATRRIVRGKRAPDLLVTDTTAVQPSDSSTWVLQFAKGQGKANAYLGPYVLRREHPLVQGLSMKGVIWTVGKPLATQGEPVVMVGELPLVSVAPTAGEGKRILVQLAPELSSLPRNPGWPIFFWNLVQWLQSEWPGLSAHNVPLGGRLWLRFPPQVSKATVTPPTGQPITLRRAGESALLSTRIPGLHRVKVGTLTQTFAVNVLAPDESNLLRARSGIWGSWSQPSVAERHNLDIGWLFALLGLVALVVHAFLLHRAARSK